MASKRTPTPTQQQPQPQQQQEAQLLPQPQQQRERGTPRDASFLHARHAIFLVILVATLSAALATLLFLYSSSSPTTTTTTSNKFHNVIFIMAFISFLGSLTTLVGIIVVDSLSHAFVFGLAMILVNWGNGISSAILVASPPLLLTLISGPKNVLVGVSPTSSDLLFHPMTIRSYCLIPFIFVIHESMMIISNKLEFRAAPICFITFVTMGLMHVYYTHRAHKHGSLLTREMKCHSIWVGISMLLSCQIAMHINSMSAVYMTVFFLGALVAILLGCSFAFVADVWYAVGSGQFLMISLDTAGMMLYFICPTVIMVLRFLDKYGESIASWCNMFREYYVQFMPSVLFKIGADYEDSFPFSLLILLVMVSSVIGVPLLNALCPIGGYLFSRAYTHGQPNTKRVALCVNFSDLPRDNDDLWDEFLEKKKVGDRGRDNKQLAAVLNIYVTLEELTLHRNELQMIAKRGHFVALSPTEFDDTYFGPSILFGNNETCNLQIAHFEYTELFGEEPKWLLSRSAGSIGRHPAMLCEARNLGMKVVYWSTLIMLHTGARSLSIDHQNAIRDDCSDKNGGSIIYLTFEKSSNTRNLITPNLLREVIDSIGGGYSLESLSDVARDDADMVLH